MMSPDDKPTFAKMMATFFAVYQAELTPKVLDIWWGVLFDCDLQDIREAMNAHVADPEAGMFVPRPAHIINRMHAAKKLRDESLRQLRDEMMVRVREFDSEIYRINNDLRLGIIDDKTADLRREEMKSAIRNVYRMPEYKLVWQQKRLGNL